MEIMIALHTITLDAMSSVPMKVAIARFEPLRPTGERCEIDLGREMPGGKWDPDI